MSPSFAFPRASYLEQTGPKARTSFSLDANVDFVSVAFDFGEKEKGKVDLGLALSYTSPSLSYNQTRLKAYEGLGAGIGLQWIHEDRYRLGVRARMLYSHFIELDSYFLALDCSLVPGIDLVRGAHSSFTLALPVTASFKADTVTLRCGLCGAFRFANTLSKEGTQ